MINPKIQPKTKKTKEELYFDGYSKKFLSANILTFT